MKTLFLSIWGSPTEHSRRRLWFAWGVVVVMVFIVHCLTISVLPSIWQDEVQIFEYGRSIFNPQTNWSINWNFELNRPILLLTYLANVLQEMVLRLNHFSLVGPRLASLVGAIMAATVTLAWLLARKVQPKVAWLLSLIFLLDPVFVQSYRGVRVDCWVFVSCIGACWLLSLAQTHHAQASSRLLPLAGGCAAVAIFTWPSAILLYPLILFELIPLLFQKRELHPAFLSRLIAFAVGALITGVVLLLPIWPQVALAVGDMRTLTKTASLAGISEKSGSDWLTLLNNQLLKFGLSFTNSPFLPLIALVTLLYRRHSALLFSTLCATALVFTTGVYIFRAIYLLPYFVLVISTLYRVDAGSQADTRQLSFRKVHWLKNSLLILLLGWSFVVTIVITPIVGFDHQADRNPQVLQDIATTTIGAGEKKVFLLGAIEFYHAGRSLQWQMFWQQLNQRSPQFYLAMLENPAYQNVFKQLDYMIVSQKMMIPELQQAMDQAGLRHSFKISAAKPDASSTPRTRSIYLQPYGPYIVFTRK